MKRYKIRLSLLLTLICILTSAVSVFADSSLAALYKVATVEGSVYEVAGKVKESLKSNNFEILGEYKPASKSNTYLVAFTNDELIKVAENVHERGLLGCALKVGFLSNTPGEVDIYLLNPEYLFYSYFGHNISKYEATLSGISLDVVIAMSEFGRPVPVEEAGTLSTNELKSFKKMARMPGFDSPIELNTFGSFEEGLRKIKSKLQAKRGGVYKVYEYINEEKKIAVFGVGLLDSRYGEPKFLPVLGEELLVALPYELILVDNKASMLDGSFRFPLFWTQIKIQDFSKISRISQDIEYTLRELTN